MKPTSQTKTPFCSSRCYCLLAFFSLHSFIFSSFLDCFNRSAPDTKKRVITTVNEYETNTRGVIRILILTSVVYRILLFCCCRCVLISMYVVCCVFKSKVNSLKRFCFVWQLDGRMLVYISPLKFYVDCGCVLSG